MEPERVTPPDLRAIEAYAERIAAGEEVMPVLAAASTGVATRLTGVAGRELRQERLRTAEDRGEARRDHLRSEQV